MNNRISDHSAIQKDLIPTVFDMKSILIIASLILTFVPHASAQDVRLSEDTANAVEHLLMEKIAEAQIPGLSATIVVDGKIVWSNGYGMADLENGVPATASTAYRVASIGKTMTATAVMQLVEQGKVDLDAPVQRYCPVFPEKKWPVTTRHLMGHTSGIRHYGGPNAQAELFNTVHYDDVITPLDIFKDDPLLFEPGTEHQYSSFGYNLLGCAIVGASGQDFRTYMQEHVFLPAGMKSTRDDDPAAIIPRRAEGYLFTDEGTLRNAHAVDMSSKLPAGGFISTTEDLARFAIALMDHRLIQSATLEQMITPVVLTNGEVVGNGLGWGLFPGEDWYGEREAFHGGVTPQVSGMIYMLPDRDFAVTLLMNLEWVSGRSQLSAEIAKEVLGLGN